MTMNLRNILFAAATTVAGVVGVSLLPEDKEAALRSAFFDPRYPNVESGKSSAVPTVHAFSRVTGDSVSMPRQERIIRDEPLRPAPPQP